jgi:hypothetical protein
MCIFYQIQILPQSFSFAFNMIAIRSKNASYPLDFMMRITQHAGTVSMGGNGAVGDISGILAVNKLTFAISLRPQLRGQGDIFRALHKPVDNS